MRDEEPVEQPKEQPLSCRHRSTDADEATAKFVWDAIVTELYNPADKSVPEIVASIEARLQADEDTTGDRHVREIVVDSLSTLNGRIAMADAGESPGIPTGFADVDRLVTGLHQTEMTVLAARPGMGKTALVIRLAHNACAAGNTVLVFSLEQRDRELVDRLLAAEARLPATMFRTGVVDPNASGALMAAAKTAGDLSLFVDDTPGRSVAEIASVARRRKRLTGLDMLVVDYVQLIEPEDRRASREQQVSTISRQLKVLAKQLEVPVIVLAQLNRAVETRSDKEPKLSDLRESGALEQDADHVWFLHRPSYFDADKDLGHAVLVCAKNRHGGTGNVPLTWIAESMRFETRAPEYSFPSDQL